MTTKLESDFELRSLLQLEKGNEVDRLGYRYFNDMRIKRLIDPIIFKIPPTNSQNPKNFLSLSDYFYKYYKSLNIIENFSKFLEDLFPSSIISIPSLDKTKNLYIPGRRDRVLIGGRFSYKILYPNPIRNFKVFESVGSDEIERLRRRYTFRKLNGWYLPVYIYGDEKLELTKIREDQKPSNTPGYKEPQDTLEYTEQDSSSYSEVLEETKVLRLDELLQITRREEENYIRFLKFVNLYLYFGLESRHYSEAYYKNI